MAASMITPAQRAYTDRFRKVSTLHPRLVTEAYGGDTAQAMADDDQTVAARVAAWEMGQGRTPRDWEAWGRDEEGRDD